MAELDIPSLRLDNQRLTGVPLERPDEVVSWLGAVQAQDYAGAKWALGLRLKNAADRFVEQAFTEGAILRTHLLRPTWHFVTPADIHWLLALTAGRVQSTNAYMYRKLDLDSAVFRRSNDVLIKALQGGRQLTRDELRAALQSAGIRTDGELRMGYLLMHAELEGIICSGARRGKQFTYTLLDERLPLARTLQRSEALAELSRRYFLSRGPATVQDFSKWSGLTLSEARAGLEAIQDRLQQQTVNGRVFWFSASGSPSREEPPQAFLLSIYDEYFSSYKDHSMVADTETHTRLAGLGNALSYVILLNGQIAGTFRRTFRKESLVLEIGYFGQLSETGRQAVMQAARRFGAFYDLRVELAWL